MIKEFKEFSMKGNIMDLAIGVIIGGAFGKIVSSLVSDILMPVFGLILGRIDFANLFIVLGNGSFKTLEDAKKVGIATLNYGLFINNIINFLIISFSIFIVIKQINRVNKKPAPIEDKKTKTCSFCYSEINTAATRCPNCTSSLQ